MEILNLSWHEDQDYIHWEKNIVNFNKYLVQYCQLNIYLQ